MYFRWGWLPLPGPLGPGQTIIMYHPSGYRDPVQSLRLCKISETWLWGFGLTFRGNWIWKKRWYKIWSFCGLRMQRVRSCSVDLVNSQVTLFQSTPGLFCYLSQKIIFATKRILTDCVVILPFRRSSTTWVSLFGTGLLPACWLN